MELKINTSIKNAEVANCILARIIEALNESPKYKRDEVLGEWGLKESDIKKAAMFRKSLVKSILSPNK